MIRSLSNPLDRITSILTDIGACVMFVKELARIFVKQGCPTKLIFEQIWSVTMQSMPTTAMAGFLWVRS